MSKVATGNFDLIQKMESDLWKHKVDVKDEHTRYIFKLDNVRITVYKSNKIMFQGKDEDKYFSKYFTDINIDDKVEKDIPINNVYPMIGSDEVGVGDYFGPLVVAAAYVDEKALEKLKTLDIKDTKKLTDFKIIELANELEQIIPMEIALFTNKEFNELTDKGFNGHELKTILHNKVHVSMYKKYPGAFHVIDQYVNEKKYYEYFNKIKMESLKGIHFETKAEDKYIAVACAAIIARKYFLFHINKISEELNIAIPLGAGSKVDDIICEIREIYGEEKLKEVGKYSFANTTKTLK